MASQPARANDVRGGWGNCTPRPMPGTQTTCQRSAVPAPARNARHAMLRPRYPHLTTNAAATACGGRAMRCAPDHARHGQRVRARPGPQVRPQKKPLLPATVGHYKQVIYPCPRKRGPIYAQRKVSRGAATAGTGRGNWMGGGHVMRMVCRRSGDWCRGWPRAIGAGAVGHGTRGGVAACVRKS